MKTGFAIYSTKFGQIKIQYEDDYIVLVKRVSREEDSKIIEKSERGKTTKLTDSVYKQVCEYLEGRRKSFDFKYKLIGTDFYKKVWRALLDIPYGETRTYKDIAIAVGNEKASRAVGMANNKNPITIAIPCHRVIGSDGKLTGYFGGVEMKRALLDMELKNK